MTSFNELALPGLLLNTPGHSQGFVEGGSGRNLQGKASAGGFLPCEVSESGTMRDAGGGRIHCLLTGLAIVPLLHC